MPIVDTHLKRQRIVYGICTAALLLFSGFSLYRINWPNRSEPVAWDEYSSDKRDSLLAKGKKVVVFVYAVCAVESEISFRNLDASKFVEACGGNDCEALLLRYDDWSDPSIRSIWDDVWHTKYPFVVRYSPDATAVAFDPYSLELLERPRYNK
ncbi:MAG: hypothetical protein AB7G28_14405 [Pirellulales bacterium]